MATFYQTTARRLRQYYHFSDDTINAVARFAEKQKAYATYQDFFGAVAMPPVTVYKIGPKQGAAVIDIVPKGVTSRVIVVHLPMGNPLDPNQQYQLATLAGMFPDARIIGFGNPSGEPYKHHEHDLRFLQKVGIASGLRPRALVGAELAYLQEQGITQAVYVGYSYGALKALVAASYSPEGMVGQLITIELVSHRRSPFRLVKDFRRTIEPLASYVDVTGLEMFKIARSDSIDGAEYERGLHRPINLAIGSFISACDALKKLERVVRRRTDLRVAMAWGTKSELVDDVRMQRAVAKLERLAPGRIQALPLAGQMHGLANDVHLHAAIVYEVLRQPLD